MCPDNTNFVLRLNETFKVVWEGQKALHPYFRVSNPNRQDTHLSKRLAWLLRHGALEEGLEFIDGCYLAVDDILAHRQFRRVTVADISRVVENDSKGRYELRSVAGANTNSGLQIRAVQGHSVKVEGLDLMQITAANWDQYPTVVHGTYTKCWPSILSQGLRRMNRTHIHFACGDLGDANVISGLRRSAEILIYIDLKRAITDGVEFFVSINNVILCEGDSVSGALPVTYFKEVWKLKPYRLLIFADGQPTE